MSTRRYTRFFFPVFFLIVLIPLVSCQVGLGSAVDTQVPTLQITYPPASSVIKGTFSLAGTCDDDQGVSSIAVNVRNITTGSSTPYTISSGDITNGTNWKISLNAYDSANTAYNGWQFPDGKYEITVTASDSAGHTSGSSARTVIIDNTPPVLILSSPLKTGSDEASTYGRTINLAGDIADDNTVSTLAMTLYPYNTATKTLSSASVSLDVTDFSQMSTDNPLIIARYYTAAEAGTDTTKLALRKNYLKIYNDGSDDSSDIGTAETKTYYCGIILTDNAKTYTTAGDSGTGTGNATSVYYINNTTGFYDKLMTESTYNLTALKLKNILNGTTTEYTAAQITAIKNILAASGNAASSTTITAGASSKISVNPNNDPHYSVSGYEIGSANNSYADPQTGYRTCPSGSTLTLSLSAGLDKYYVKPSSVSIVLKNTTAGTSQTVLQEGSWTSDDATSADYTIYLDSTKYTLVSNNYYTIVVSGKDRNGNDLYPLNETGYGFMLKTIYSKPVVEFKDQSGTEFFGTSDVYYSASTVKSAVIPVKVATDGLAMDASAPLTVTISGSPSLTWSTSYAGSSGYYYYYNVAVTNIGSAASVSDKSKYTLSVTAKDSEADTAGATGYFYLDDKSPSSAISTVTPTVSRASDNAVCVNGTVTVSGTVTESNLSSVVLNVSDTAGHSNSLNLGAVYSFSQTVDTTKYSGTITFTLTATDAVGNSGSSKASYVIDQSTDAPSVSLSNADISIKEASGITSGTNLFGTTSNNKLLGTVSDDDGVKSVTVGYRDYGSTGSYTSTQVLSGGSSTTYSLNYTLPSIEKQYDILIQVTDTKGETTGYSSISKGFVLAVDAGAPVFSNVTPASSLTSYYSGTLPVSGTITEGSGTVSLSASHIKYSDSSVPSGASSTPALATGAVPATGAAWTDSITLPASSGQYTVLYTATDKYGQSSTYAIAYSVDITAPSIAIKQIDKTDIVSPAYLKKASHTFTGTADDTGGSGLSSVTYKVTDGSNIVQASGTASVSGGSWSATIDMSGLEGTYTAVFTAADAAGNTTKPFATVCVDGTAPVSTLGVSGGSLYGSTAGVSGGPVSAPAFGTSYLANTVFTLGGVITETYFSSASLSVTKNGKTVTGAKFTTGGSASGAWSYAQSADTVTHTDDGVYVYTITVRDLAGNQFSGSVTVTVDTTGPVLAITDPAQNEAVNTNLYTIDGTVSDGGSAVQTVTYTLSTGSTDAAATVAGSSWTTGAVSLGSKEGTLTLTAKATDILDNTTTTSAVRTFYYDKNPPTLSETSVTADGLTTNGGFSLAGLAGDTNALYGNGTGAVTVSNGTKTWTVDVSDKQSGTWTQAFVTGSSNSSAANYIADGTTIFTVTAQDITGKTTALTRTVKVDTTAPTVSGSSLADSMVKLDESVYDKITVTASDSTTGLAGVYYQITSSNTQPAFTAANESSSWTPLAQGSSGWTANADFTGYADGTYYVWAGAKDNADNRAVRGTPVSVKVDKQKPVTAVTAGSATTVASADDTLTIRVSDTNPGTPVVTVRSPSGTAVSVTITPVSQSVQPGYTTWTADIPFSTSSGSFTADGTYTVSVNETDQNGRTADTVTYGILKDTAAPVVTIGTPAAALYSGATSYQFKGTASDANLSSVTVSLYKDGSATASSESDLTNALDSSGNWTWKQYDLADGVYKIAVVALDKVGHSTTAESFLVTVDTTVPATTFGVSSGSLYDKTAGTSGSAITSPVFGTSYLANTGFTLGGTITETNFNSAVLSVTKNGGTPSTTTFASKDWSYAQNADTSTHTDDGVYVYTLKVTDLAGNQFTGSVTVTVDTTAPSIAVTAPSAGEYFDSTAQSTGIAFKGTQSDSGAGVKSVTYSITETMSAADEPTTLASSSWTGKLTWDSTNNAFVDSNSISIIKDEGTYHIVATATDILGNTATSSTVLFYFDKSVPALTEAVTSAVIPAISAGTADYGVGSSGKTTNAAYTLYGTASDTNALSATNPVTVVDKLNDTTVGTYYPTVTGGVWYLQLTPVSSGASSANSTVADGVHSYTVTAADVAGKTTTVTRTVTTDTVVPAWNTGKVSGTLPYLPSATYSYTDSGTTYNYFKSSSISVTALASDATSGVEKLQYKLNTGDYTDTGNNSFTVSGTEGYNTLLVRAVDNAGNTTGDVSLPFYVDSTAPAVCTLTTVGGSADGVSDLTAGTTTKLVNGKNALSVTVSTADYTPASGFKSGIKSVALTKVGSASVTASSADGTLASSGSSGVYALTIPAAKQSTGTVTVRVTDNAGNYADFSLFEMQLDATKPKVSVTSPSTDATVVNKTITVSGTASDNTGLATTTINSTVTEYITLSFSTDGSTYGTGTAIAVGSDGTWSYSLDTTAYNATSTAKTLYVKAVASDTAGNSTSDTTDRNGAAVSDTSAVRTVSINQDTDRPVITVNNLDMSGMTASSSVWLKGSRKIYGTISDDDGIAETGGLTIGYKYTGDTAFTTAALTVSSGSWNYTLPKDGTCEIEFTAIDAAGTSFTTASSVTTESVLLTTPKILDSNGTKFGYTTASNPDTMLHVTIDISNPELQSVKISTDGGTTWTDSTSGLKLGGSVQSFWLRFDSYDVNGINVNGLSVVTSGLTTNGGKTEVAAATYKYGSTTDGRSPTAIDTSAVSTENFADTNKTIPYTTYTFKAIPCSTGDGSMVVTVTTTDNASNEKSSLVTLSVDNTSPVVTVLGPASATTSSGSVTVYGSIDGTASIYYAVSPSGTVSPDADSASTSFTYDTADSSGNAITLKNAATISAATSYSQITDASLSWYVYFDGGSGDTKTHSAALNTWLETLGITTTAAITANTYKDVTKLYVWIKSVDAYGNKSETAHRILLDPQGDRPTVDIDYPESDGTALGGTVKLYGSADDNSAVKNVFVQIMSEQHSVSAYTANGTSFGSLAYNSSTYETTTFTPSADDLDYLAMAGYKIYKMSDSVTSSSTGYWVAGTSSLASGESASDYGILATLNGSAWSLKINTSGELNPTGDTSNIVAVRVYAYDDGNTQSLAADRTMKFDKNNPVFGSISLVQSEGIANPYTYNADTTAEQECTSGLYVRGTWYIKGSVTDDNGISDLIISDNSTDYSIVSGQAGSGAGTPVSSTKWEAVQSADGKTCYFKYTLSTSSGVGKHVITVTAKDGTNTQYTSMYSATVNYDNTSPVLASSADSSYSISPSVSQSDSFYTMSSTVSESSVSGVSQSGFKRLAFYFVRRYGSTYVYDPMLVKGSSSNKVDIISGTAGGTIVYDSGLYWKKENVSWSSDTANVVTLSAADDNIHTGGLVKANGIIYTIKSVSGTTIMLDGNLTKSPGTAYAALALVVDNTVSEGYSTSASLESDGYYSSANLTNDDGDRMIEYVSNTGTVWTWQANICSKNIPDGPIEIHYVAFDAAGNSSTGVVGHVSSTDYAAYKNTAAFDSADVDAYAANSSAVSVYAYNSANPAFVSNNRPRIAGVTIGTDYDNNGTVDSDEEENSYSAANYSADSVTGTTGGKNVYDPTAKSLTKYKITALPVDLTLGTSSSPLLTLKGYSEIIPEIVGGNGAIYYQYSCGSLSGKNSTTALVADGSTNYTVDTSGTVKLQLGDLIQAGDTANTPFVFTFWDSTDGSDNFASTTSGRQYAKLTLYLGVSVQAVGTPAAKIAPFYWNSSSDNSLYGNSSANGHIELEKDWALSPGHTSSVLSDEEKDADPKVSGKVVIKGTAHDDTRINKLYVSVPGMESNFAGAGITDTQTVNSTVYYCLATYSSATGKLVPVDGSAYGFALSLSSDAFSSSGHDVNWAFTWDTSKISTVAAADVKVQVLAYNQGKPSCSTGSGYSALGHLSIDGATYYSDPAYTGGKANTPDSAQTTSTTATSYYKMDVVPYIKSISTSLDKAYSSKPSVFNRSATGYYPVRRGETIALGGFNLNGASTGVTVNGSSTDLTVGASGSNVTVALGTATGKNVKSGAVQVTVGTIVSLNNVNNDSSKGAYGTDTAYANSYDREPNGVNNSLLTDDRNLYVWNFTSMLSDTGVRYPTMRIGKDSSQTIGFTYDSGAQNQMMYQNTSIATGTAGYSIDYSFTQWYDTACAVDSSGRMYGIGQNGDSGGTGEQTYGGNYANAYLYAWNTSTYPGQAHIYSNGSYTWTNPSGQSYAAYSSGRKKKAIESTYSNSTFNSTRVRNPKVTTLNGSNVYAVYYDSTNNQIRFRYGTVSGTVASNNALTFTGALTDHGTSSDTGSGYQIVAGTSATGTSSVLNETNVSKAGEYCAVGAAPDGTAVIAWYNADSQQLLFSYNTTGGNASNWGSHTIAIDSDFAGWYPDMIVDPSGGIHIAYYSAGSGDLRYAYLSSYTSTTPVVSTVDSYLSCGTNISIDYKTMTDNGTYYLPYISYYMSSFTQTGYALRTAWLTDKSLIGTTANGAEDDLYTRNWECMTVPLDSAVSGIPLDYNVGIGMKENDSSVDAPTLGFGTKKGLVVAQLQ